MFHTASPCSTPPSLFGCRSGRQPQIVGSEMSVISERARAADAAFAAVKDFYFTSRYGKRRGDPGICDLTFGNPHEMPLDGLVTALRERTLPKDKNWFAYKTSEEAPASFSRRTTQARIGAAFRTAVARKEGIFVGILALSARGH